MTIYNTQSFLNSAVASNATATVLYPTGTTQGTFTAVRAVVTAVVNFNNEYTSTNFDVSATFGASNITITNLSGETWPAGSTLLVSFDVMPESADASGDNVAAPVSNLTATVGSAGAMTGTYYYTQTFVTRNGETPPWPGTAVGAAPSSQRVELTNIPIGPAGTIARKIWRTDGVTTETKNYRFLTTIEDNTTTTYTDNEPANLLIFPNWAGTNRGTLTMNGEVILAASDQTTQLGDETFGNGTPGYASTAIGYAALFDNSSGRRNTAVGVYALENNTSGYENTSLGTHAGGGLTNGAGNTMIGYAAGGATNSMLDFNTAVGSTCFSGAGTKGSQCVAVGYQALNNINTADRCIGLGVFAGKYANASGQVFVDNIDRTNLANAQNVGLIYGKGETTAIAQVLHLNALTRVGPPSLTVANLPAAAAGLTGYRAFVTDANATTFASIVAGGGANGVPVYCDGTNWRIG